MPEFLAKIQRQFMDSITLGMNFEDNVFMQSKIQKVEGMYVYKNNVRLSQLRCLAAVYPVCVKLVGNNYFTHLFDQYRLVYPQKDFDLHNYGHAFAAFLKNFELAQNIQYLSDVAQLEWAIHRAEICALDLNSGLDQFARIENEWSDPLQFQLVNSATLLESIYPIQKIWHLNQNATVDEIISLNKENIKIIVWHNGQTVHFETLADVEWEFLCGLQKNATLEQIFDQLQNIYSLQEEEGQNMLAKFLQNNCLRVLLLPQAR